MPAAVERIISKITPNASGDTAKEKYGSAIAIAKSRGLLRQKGKHLALGMGYHKK